MDKKNDLLSVINDINKTYGVNTIGFMKDMSDVNIERTPTGSLWLDYITGGGLPMGRVVEIFGNFSSGKSLIALKTIAEAQKAGKQCCLIDTENSFDPAFAEKVGVSIEGLILTQCSVGESVFDIMLALIEAKVDIIVVDSVASLIPSSEYKDSMEQQTMGLQARMMSKALRKLTAANSKTLILFINQIREKIGTFSSYGVPTASTGGRALGFYSSIRLEIKRGDDIVKNKEIIGQTIKFKTQKNKTSIPFKNGYVKFMYDTASFDRVEELVALGVILKKIKQSGPYYTYGDYKFLGGEKLRSEIATNKELLDKLTNEILNYDKELRVSAEVEKKEPVEKEGKKGRKVNTGKKNS